MRAEMTPVGICNAPPPISKTSKVAHQKSLLQGILIVGTGNEFTCGITLRGDDELLGIVADIQHISGGAVCGRRQEGVRACLHINWPLDEPQKFISITGEYRTSTASLIVPSIEMTDPSLKTRTDCGIRLNAGTKHAGGGCSRIRSGGSNTLPVRCDAAIASGYWITSVVGVRPAGVLMTPFGQSSLSTTPAVVDGVRRMGVAQPVHRSGEVDAGTLGRLFDDKIDGTLGQWIAGLPNGPEHRRRRRRMPRLANRRA